MNSLAQKTQSVTALLVKVDPTTPALLVTGPSAIAIKAGTVFAGHTFTVDTPVVIDVALVPGADYGITVSAGAVGYAKLTSVPTDTDILGGFHFAPGGNALARSGGDTVPAINPCSLWDINFRPSCSDPRGMVLIDAPAGKFWCDIYLLAKDHLANGTSQFGVTIADGNDPPQKPDGKRFKKLDYETAVAVMKHHGKGLLALDEFFAAAHGVTEKTACGDDPETTKLDAARTSKFGLMQATGNMWVWGHDGDPDEPRASIFGGSFWFDGDAGSRYASVGNWPGSSGGSVGARGRGDHLQLG